MNQPLSLNCLGFVYDFANYGGAIGTINLGSPNIPVKSQIVIVQATALTDLASGGAATVSLGLIQAGVGTPISTIDMLLPASLVAVFNNAPTGSIGGTLNQPVNCTDFISSGGSGVGLRLDTDCQVTMSIGVADLTKGKILVSVYYTQSLN